MNKQDIWATSNIALASAISLKHPLLQIDWSNVTRASFVFKHDEDIEQLEREYWAGTFLVSPQAYFNALKDLKTRLYEGRML